MDGASLNTNPTNVLGPNSATQVRDERDQGPPANNPQQDQPRVNEGPSTRTNISTQALELSRQDQVPGNGETPEVSQDNRETNASSQEGASSNSGGENGRLIDDESPNELLRG